MPTSRFDFRRYVEDLRKSGADRKQDYDSFHSTMSGQEKDKLVQRSHRSFWTLFREFIQLLSGHRRQILIGLATLTVSTLLSLLPPLGTKFAIDFALTSPPKPTPDWFPDWLKETTGLNLLIWIAVAVTSVTLLRTCAHLWGRWECTKAVNQVQTSIRKKVFEHMLQMPLHRVQLLKSGGSASLLREDAGGIADLVFSMLYNPWQAIVQLIGSFIVLVIVDWRLLAAGLLLLPVVYLTHRTWIYRIRPLYRDLRATRQNLWKKTQRIAALCSRQSLCSSASPPGLVAYPPDRGDLGGSDPACINPPAGLRRLANPPRPIDPRRPDDVLGLPRHAARSDRNTYGQRGSIPKQPRWTRSYS
jgi:ATP-binding cassette subfamily B protein/subfamily B ATP-binding cassette protein MsbA